MPQQQQVAKDEQGSVLDTVQNRLPQGRVIRIKDKLIRLPGGISTPAQVEIFVRREAGADPEWWKKWPAYEPDAMEAGARLPKNRPLTDEEAAENSLLQESAAKKALPQIGGILGSLLGPAGGTVGAIAGRVGGAALGGGAGEALASMFGSGQPKSSGEAAERILEGAGGQALAEAVPAFVFKGASGIVNAIKNSLPAKRAGKLLADEILASDISPGKMADAVRAAFDQVDDQAGKAVRSTLNTAARNPALTTDAPNLAQAVKAEIAEISGKNPAASKDLSEPTGKILRALRDLEGRIPYERNGRVYVKNPMERPAPTGSIQGSAAFTNWKPEVEITSEDAMNILFDARKDFFKATKEASYSEARRVASKISQAAHKDIATSLDNAGLSQERISFEQASKNYRELQDTAEKDTLRRIFGDKRASSDAVIGLMRKAPEESIRAIKDIVAKGGPNELQPVRRALLENYLHRKGGIPQDSIVNEVFGADGKKIIKFSELLAESSPQSFTEKIFSSIGFKIPGTQSGRAYFVDPNGRVIQISVSKLAKILDNKQALDAAVAVQSESRNAVGQKVSKSVSNASRLLWLLLSADEDEPDKTSSPIGDSLKPDQRKKLLEQRERLSQ